MRLSVLYPTLSTEEREELAQKTGTSAGYLYQLATRWQGKRPSLRLLLQLAKADSRLTLEDMAEEFDGAPKRKSPPYREPSGA